MLKSVKINGDSKSIYDCVLCGKKLTQKEYFAASDMCTECRRENYHRFNRDYVDSYGNNKIDVILINKIRKEI